MFDNRVLPEDRDALPPVGFGRPLLDRYETPISLMRSQQRLVFVGHLVAKFRYSVARWFGQKVSDRSSALPFFRNSPALTATAGGRIFDLFGGGGAAFPGGSGFPGKSGFWFSAFCRIRR
jgi:hypothetical protein